MLSGPAQAARSARSRASCASPAMVMSSAMRQRLVGDAVIVEEVVEANSAVRQRRDVGAHQRFGARAKDRRAPR